METIKYKTNIEEKNIITTSKESITVDIEFSFTTFKYSAIVYCNVYNQEYMSLQELLNEINNLLSLKDYQILYYNYTNFSFIYYGIYPDKLIYNKIYLKETIQNEKNFETILVKFRLREIINKDNALHMDYFSSIYHNDNDENDEIEEKKFVEKKSRRAKERKIGNVIKKVYIWRKLYNGFTNGNGKNIKLTLEEAALKVGISKKSLDDYLIQLREGRKYKFNFNEHQNDKIGILRSFIRKNKQYK